MKQMIQVFSNSHSEEEVRAIRKVLKSHWTGYGSEAKNFEKEFGERIGNSRTLLTNTCTAALFMSMKILGIGKGDEVILPTVHFPGCVNAILHVGAKPVFADIDEEFLNIMPSEILRLKNPKTKAILLLHYGGHPANFSAIKKAAGKIKIIEDSANSPFSLYKNKNCGTLGDIGCYSFDAMKILTMGDGGAIALKNNKLYDRAKVYRYLGLSPKESSGIDSLKEKKKRWWEIDIVTPANRHTSNDILASIARIQLKKIDSFLKKRKEIWERYQKELGGVDWIKTPPQPLSHTTSSYYMYWLRVLNGKRDELANYLVSNGVYVTFRYQPLHLVEAFKQNGVHLPNAEKANEEILNIPLHQNLTSSQVSYIIKKIKAFK